MSGLREALAREVRANLPANRGIGERMWEDWADDIVAASFALLALPEHRDEVRALIGDEQVGMPTQAQTLAWVAGRWPDRTGLIWRAGKVCEEAGEVMGAVIKMDEGRKTLADLRMETAQVVICAMALAESAGFDLWEAVTEYGPTHPTPREES